MAVQIEGGKTRAWHLARWLRLAAEFLACTILLLAARCANYQDVFIGGNIYFSDADCYSRMTRVRLCAEHPGTILRRHDFENYPAGTTPHTTVIFDYLIVGLAALLQPFSAQALDLAGAWISPLLGLAAGWFLWGWARYLALPFRGCLVTLFALSPIIAHGTELGRPDHQSLIMLLVTTALAAEWAWLRTRRRGWTLVSGASWGLALWTSLYEPLILLAGLLICDALWRREAFRTERRTGWLVAAAIALAALAIEWRPLAASVLVEGGVFGNWAATIGELASVRWLDPIWLQWTSALVVATPLLLWWGRKRAGGNYPATLVALLVGTFFLTHWQARWGYFFASTFVLTLPLQLSAITGKWRARMIFVACLWPVLSAWDAFLFPSAAENEMRLERRQDAVAWREAALQTRAEQTEPILAPWWLSPAASYWSRQPAVAGSSHESLPGIADSARFFLTTNAEEAREILRARKVAWVMAYDGGRTVQTSATILGIAPPRAALGEILDNNPGRAPGFLVLSYRNSACKLYRVRD